MPEEIPQETRMLLIDNISVSPRALCLLGTNLPLQRSSSFASRKELNEEDTSLSLSVNSNANTKVTSYDSKVLKKKAREIKRKRSLWNKDRQKDKQIGVSTEIALSTFPWTIKKTLCASDVGKAYQLLVKKSDAECHIVKHLSEHDQRELNEGKEIQVRVYDHDTKTEDMLILKKLSNKARNYILKKGWVRNFVRRRDLKKGSKIGLFWNCVSSKLHFCVFSPSSAAQKNSNSMDE